MAELDAERWLDTKAAAALCGMHVETFRRLEREGKAPRPEFHPTPRKRFWRLGTLRQWSGENA